MGGGCAAVPEIGGNPGGDAYSLILCPISQTWVPEIPNCIRQRTYSCIPLVIDEDTTYCTCELTDDTYVRCGECVNSGEDSCGTYVTCRESCNPSNLEDLCPGECPGDCIID